MNIGIGEFLIIILIVVLIFGAGKLPKVMGDVGKGIRHFQKGLSDNKQDNKKSKK